MASLTIPALPVPVAPVGAPPPVNAVAAALPGLLLQAEADALALPAAQPAPSAAQGGDTGQDGAAMRPDQIVMARQLSWPAQDGGALAAAWRGMVRGYGAQVAAREQQANAGQLPVALLLGGQDPRVLRQPELAGTPLDAWRFTIHAGNAREQHLRIVDGDPEQDRQKRRRRGRAALRLELVLADGAVVTLQALPVGDGLVIELCAPDARTVARLRDLQPRFEEAVERAGLRVLGWTWRDTLPDGRVHARLPSAEAADALTLPVFRAMAELALVLPVGTTATGS